ncbi:glycine cleavage system protein H [uncultured Desulfosarcina sp.]|uniref:glycine cleavage system protein H n=1 Tax=uncultured Desulfosarcina sp. TaxID=218289 RepID=UPI0029C9884F|nr:glycine cleavage system protein H [uncultured Desulfosarcina sp.]
MNQRQQQTPADPCIWMQAGVVKAKMCRRAYDCNGCRFDRILRQLAEENRERLAAGGAVSGRRGRIVYWADKLREMPAHRRPCLHHLKRRIDFRPCTNDYLCSNCEFDQYFQDQYAVHAVIQPVGMKDVHGVKIPQGVYFHQGHTWVGLASGGQVRVGLDAFAARLLGTMEAIDLPLMGKPVQRDHVGVRMRRGALNADLLSPVSGVVTAFNPEVKTAPGAVPADPYGKGWLLMVQPTDLREDLRSLQMGMEATTFIEAEMDRLYQALETELGPMATDGGHLADDILGQLPQSCWEKMARQFLRS